MLRVRVQLRYQKCLDAHARSVVQLKHQTAAETERESKVCTLVEDSSTASVYSPYIPEVMILICRDVHLICTNDLLSLTGCLNLLISELAFTYVRIGQL